LGLLAGSLCNSFFGRIRGRFVLLLINNEEVDHDVHELHFFQRFRPKTAWSPKVYRPRLFLGPLWGKPTALGRGGCAKTRARDPATQPQKAFFEPRAPDDRAFDQPNLQNNGRSSRDHGRNQPWPHGNDKTSTPSTQKHNHDMHVFRCDTHTHVLVPHMV